jgi:hypothetical protein
MASLGAWAVVAGVPSSFEGSPGAHADVASAATTQVVIQAFVRIVDFLRKPRCTVAIGGRDARRMNFPAP